MAFAASPFGLENMELLEFGSNRELYIQTQNVALQVHIADAEEC